MQKIVFVSYAERLKNLETNVNNQKRDFYQAFNDGEIGVMVDIFFKNRSQQLLFREDERLCSINREFIFYIEILRERYQMVEESEELFEVFFEIIEKMIDEAGISDELI